jgi:hypothetical protein
LIHFGARYYEPTLGVWTQGGRGFVYGGDNPINASDPSGESPIGCHSATAACGIEEKVQQFLNELCAPEPREVDFDGHVSTCFQVRARREYEFNGTNRRVLNVLKECINGLVEGKISTVLAKMAFRPVASCVFGVFQAQLSSLIRKGLQ